MTTGLQLAILAGGLIALGAVLLIARLLRSDPDLAEALARLTPSRARPTAITATGATQGKERIGVWAIRALPPAVWV